MPELSRRAALTAPLALAACAKGGGFAGACPGRPIGEVPMVPVGDAWLVPVKINGQDWAMTLDTGAAASLLSREAAKALKLGAYGHDETVVGAASGYDRGQFAGIDHFAFAGIDLRGVLLPVTDLVTPTFDLLPVAGRLGMANVWVFDFQLDFSGRTMRLYTRADCDSPKPDWDGPYTEVPMRPVASSVNRARNADVETADSRASGVNRTDVSRLLLEVSVNGHTFVALLDTGAGRSVLNADAAALAGIGTAGIAVQGADARGGRLDMTLIQATTVRVGSMTWADMPLHVASGRLDFGVDLLFGQDLMRGRRLWAMLDAKKLFLQRA